MLERVRNIFRALKLQHRLFLLMMAVSLFQVCLVVGFNYQYISSTRYDEMGDHALDVAKLLAEVPQIKTAIKGNGSEPLPPLIESWRSALKVSFIVVGDANGIRLAHPIKERIGKPMRGGDNDRALKFKQQYISIATGSMGKSMRGKAPILDRNGDVIGVISVGYLMKDIDRQVAKFRNLILLIGAGVLVLNIFLTRWIARRFKKPILGFEPEEMGQLFQEKRATLHTLREGVVTVNELGVIRSMNPAAKRMLGLNPKQPYTGQQIYDLFREGQLTRLFSPAEPKQDFELNVKGLNLIFNSQTIYVENEYRGTVASFRRKDEIEELASQLSQIRSYAEMLRVQTHEHANKLNTIAGLIQLQAYDEALVLIGRESSDTQSLIAFLLEAVPSPVVSGLILGKYNRAKELGMLLEVDQESSLVDWPRDLEAEHLVTILGNLIENAFDACLREKNRQGQIFISMTDFGADLIIEVEDNGPGVPDHIVDRIFEKGVSSKTEKDHGYGLYLVKKILDSLGGTITLEPVSPKGSRFIIYLPKN